ncbi:MAG: HD domain-containing protein [Coriobacteriia bacterium]|nr:HD domain-containing protein [Coriobacteriia bacterium]
MNRSVAIVVAVLGAAAFLGSSLEGSDTILLYFSILGGIVALRATAPTLPRGQSLYLDVGVVVAGIALISPALLTSAYLAGALLGTMLQQRTLMPRQAALGVLLRSLPVSILAFTYHRTLTVYEIGMPSLFGLLGLLAAGVFLMGLEIAVHSFVGERGIRRPTMPSALEIARMLGSGLLAQVSVGAVVALVYPGLGALSFAVMLILMLIMQHTTGMLLKIRAAPMRTIGALVRAVETQSGLLPGTAERVAALSMDIGRRIGLRPHELERLAYAALLHDVGRLKNGALADRAEVAQLGAEIVSQVSLLASTGQILRLTGITYEEQRHSRGSDSRLARVIRVAADICNLMNTGGLTLYQAVHVIGENKGSVYDPDVIEAALWAMGRHQGTR